MGDLIIINRGWLHRFEKITDGKERRHLCTTIKSHKHKGIKILVVPVPFVPVKSVAILFETYQNKL